MAPIFRGVEPLGKRNQRGGVSDGIDGQKQTDSWKEDLDQYIIKEPTGAIYKVGEGQQHSLLQSALRSLHTIFGGLCACP